MCYRESIAYNCTYFLLKSTIEKLVYLFARAASHIYPRNVLFAIDTYHLWKMMMTYCILHTMNSWYFSNQGEDLAPILLSSYCSIYSDLFKHNLTIQSLTLLKNKALYFLGPGYLQEVFFVPTSLDVIPW